jgi:Dipeptidyl aminopeptidases/acylaminoacyl-peptidases
VIQYRYPGDDYKDLMAGVDEVIKRGYIDDKKLGVTGGSGGGLLTNWVVGQTGALLQPSRSAISPVGKTGGTQETSRSSSRIGFDRRHSKIRTSIGRGHRSVTSTM